MGGGREGGEGGGHWSVHRAFKMVVAKSRTTAHKVVVCLFFCIE